jgi:RNA polymerase sigma-70 factor (ECF subfamily)
MPEEIPRKTEAPLTTNRNHFLLETGLSATRSYLRKIADEEIGGVLKAKEGASDIVQDTLLEAFRDFGQFRGTTPNELRAWLRRILIHNIGRAANYYSRKKREASLEVPGLLASSRAEAAGIIADTTSPSAVVIREELVTMVAEVLSQLSERDRQLIVWRLEGCTFEEMGRRAGYSAPAAQKNWLKALERARRKLSPLADP